MWLLMLIQAGGKVGLLNCSVAGLTVIAQSELSMCWFSVQWQQGKSNVMDSNLVDSASSHTLVSKIKPCMSKYKSLTLKLRTAHYISYSLFDSPLLLG